MDTAQEPPVAEAGLQEHIQKNFKEAEYSVARETDRMFEKLFITQFFAGVLAAVMIAPRTWYGSHSAIHPHVWAALGLGLLIAAPPIYFIRRSPGSLRTRLLVGAFQMLASALLIHLTGGRIETHFHVFGSLAFLSFYRDWRVYVPATIVVALDHYIRGSYFPLSVFGVAEVASWRWLEHAAWVLFCVYFLVSSVKRSRSEMLSIARQQAQLERNNALVESEVRQRTRELLAEKSRFLWAFEMAPIGMALLDAEARVTKVNSKLYGTLGYFPEDIEGKLLQDLLLENESGEDHPGLTPETICSEFKVTYRGAEGEPFTFLFQASYHEGTDGGEPQLVAQFLDITEKLELSRQMQEQERRLHLSQKLESLGVLAGGIAHELNTPIQYVGDNAKFLEDLFQDELGPFLRSLDPGLVGQGELDYEFVLEEVPSALSEIQEGVQRVTRIVSSIKDYAHTGDDTSKPMDLNHIVGNSVAMSRNEWKYVAEVETELQEQLPLVYGDRSGIGQIVLNLLVNAAHAIHDSSGREAGEKGVIQIVTRGAGEGVELLLRDSGDGIPSEVKDRIFDPFFTTKDVGRGTGQGLAISLNIVKAHRGVLEVLESGGEGTCFRLWLPTGGAEPGEDHALPPAGITEMSGCYSVAKTDSEGFLESDLQSAQAPAPR